MQQQCVLLGAYTEAAADMYIFSFLLPADVILKHSNAIDKAVEVSSNSVAAEKKGISQKRLACHLQQAMLSLIHLHVVMRTYEFLVQH
jgi:hypothetical protein